VPGALPSFYSEVVRHGLVFAALEDPYRQMCQIASPVAFAAAANWCDGREAMRGECGQSPSAESPRNAMVIADLPGHRAERPWRSGYNLYLFR